MAVLFELQQTTEEGIDILTIMGEVDLSNCELFQEKLSLFLAADKLMLLRLETHYFDIEALKSFVSVNRQAKKMRCRLIVVANRMGYRILSVLKNGVEEIPTYQNIEEAFLALKQ